MLKILLMSATIACAYAGNLLIGKNQQDKYIKDSFLNCSQLIQKYGYPVETHEVQTEDGYLLTLFRIPDGRINSKSRKENIPVFLMHSLSQSSVDFIVNGPGKSLGYILADKGYDVWIGNARGNIYSKKHVRFTPKDPIFWNFSWSEIGYYDVPAMINYVLKITGRDKLQYVGHSQGATVFYVMASERPEMNEKIMSMQSLAPVAYVSNSKTPIFTLAAPYINEIKKIFNFFGIYELLPNTKLQKYIANYFCREESKYSSVCADVIYVLCGFDEAQLNKSRLPVYFSHLPAGLSSKQFVHFAQEFNSGKFRKYDYGKRKNLEIYGSATPPDYDLSKITAPVAIHYSDNDLFVNTIDVNRLESELGNSLGKFRVPWDEFNHMDFLWGKDASTLLYNRVLEIMERFDE